MAANLTKAAAEAPTGSVVSARPAKVAKTKETLNMLSTAVPIVGAVGTLFVWLSANFYVGNVDVQASHPYKNITVQVFNQKGEEFTFHTPHFQLMPGRYHFSVSTDGTGGQSADSEVALGKTCILQVVAEKPEPTAGPEISADSKSTARKHWWQLWKKLQASKAKSESM